MSHSTLQREIFLRFGPELDSLVHLLDQTETKEYEEFLNEYLTLTPLYGSGTPRQFITIPRRGGSA